MAVKLYVGHLSLRVTQAQVTELFSQVGGVSEPFLATDRYTGESNGFAFITMDTEAQAQEAVTRFNGQVFEGLAMTVQRLVDSEKNTIRKIKAPVVLDADKHL